MGQITVDLDDEVRERMQAAAEARGISLSRWIADLVREKTLAQWPQELRALAGSWPDLPTAEALRATLGEDVPREAL